jgi:predicted DNA-binding transcriptional regulator AlpA
MQHSNKLTLKDTALILFIVPISITRLSKSDPTFPPLEKIGRSVFIDSNKFYKWLSLKAGRTITPSDTLMTGKHLQDYYSKSHTWCWKNVKSGNLPKPFKINRTNYWIERVIVGELEKVA